MGHILVYLTVPRDHSTGFGYQTQPKILLHSLLQKRVPLSGWVERETQETSVLLKQAQSFQTGVWPGAPSPRHQYGTGSDS